VGCAVLANLFSLFVGTLPLEVKVGTHRGGQSGPETTINEAASVFPSIL
jgi:hypothetical protein